MFDFPIKHSDLCNGKNKKGVTKDIAWKFEINFFLTTPTTDL